MKFKYLIILLLCACTNDFNNNSKKSSYETKGFAYIYNDEDKEKKIVSKKFDNNNLSVSHFQLKPGTIIKVINPSNQKNISLKIKKKSKYPEFYSILITEAVAKKLELKKNAPYVQVYEIKKNKSFIADRAKTFTEEKKVHSNAPVTRVKINDISKSEKREKVEVKKYSINIAEFYSRESAKLLKFKLIKELTVFDSNSLIIVKKNNNSFLLNTRAHKAINLLKNDYIVLKNYGFEELEILLHE